ncbi:MAG: bifunctional 5,10-methylenetetrahydrofolate dehydrogenase/5,10-methenyltetrahydrofolate cyclohydrolase, partial [Thaumarchaeota archaeon]|nr:bifunctional 5,10-methylenetetrahydrofolate dehydrogenase/5,10-methenyltetrahydrofolate cyclohydrolase [Nitrososphaerota archaeon]
ILMKADPVAAEMKNTVSREVSELRRARGITPKLVALLIGTDPVSRTYVSLKQKDCAEVGIKSEVVDLSDPSVSSGEVLENVKRLNDDASVHAIIPQMPFSGKISEELVFSTLNKNKDVDGLTPFRLGKLLRGEYSLTTGLLPCTPKGIVLLCQAYKVPLLGADVAIVGRGILAGEPLRKLLQDLNATAFCCHTKTRRLDNKLKEADIVVAASGRPPELYGNAGFRVNRSTVKEGSSVISVGVRKDDATGKMLFDVDTSSLKGHCSFLTPNIGGVGVMTRACLLQNTMNAVKLQLGVN